EDSAKQAFREFWSADYLSQRGWSREIAYFNDEVQPLIATNYFRGIGEDGGPSDFFWLLLDSWFIALFAVELLARSFYISRRYPNTTLLDAVLLRWYDLFFFIPFWRWLRVIPVTIRLNQSQTVNLVPLRNRINRVFLTTFAVELTEVVVLRIIDQVQNLVKEGNIRRWLVGTGTGRRYIDLNGVDEIQVISQQVSSLLLYKVLPQIKPELDALLHHSVTNAFNDAPGYQAFRRIPGIGSVPDQMAQQVVGQVSQTLYGAITGALEDERGAALTQKLVERFTAEARTQIQADQTLEEMETLVVALLEEVKINYVKQLEAEDVEQLMADNYRLYNLTQQKS
ncbi:MAG: hypothetical protein VKJ09_07195, partial [Leptolyngbya sp.]|nr:hypothetical protein [Leptolyngbya sp.]